MAQTITGKVVQVDECGNLITDIHSDRLTDAPTDESLCVAVDDHETFGLYPLEHSQPAMTLIAVSQMGGPLKIILVDDSASDLLGVQVGATVRVQW